MKKIWKENKAPIAIILIFWVFYFKFSGKFFSLFDFSKGKIVFLVYLSSLSLIAIAILFLKPKMNWKLELNDVNVIAFGIIVILLCDHISYYLYEFLTSQHQPSANQAAWNSIKSSTPFYYYSTTVILGPITEEFFYRFGFQNFFKKYISETKAILLTALIFGFLHIDGGLFHNKNPYELIYLIGYSGASIAFSYSYYKTKRISVPILLHIISNFIAII